MLAVVDPSAFQGREPSPHPLTQNAGPESQNHLQLEWPSTFKMAMASFPWPKRPATVPE